MVDLIETLIKKQLESIPSDRRLKFRDFQRLTKYLPDTIFDTEECCLWKENKIEKVRYINFYFNRKKVSIQRLLYENYIGELAKGEYLKFTCENKGLCCNLKHFEKIISTEETELDSDEDSCDDIKVKSKKKIKKNKKDKYMIPENQEFSIEFE